MLLICEGSYASDNSCGSNSSKQLVVDADVQNGQLGFFAWLFDFVRGKDEELNDDECHLPVVFEKAKKRQARRQRNSVKELFSDNEQQEKNNGKEIKQIK